MASPHEGGPISAVLVYTVCPFHLGLWRGVERGGVGYTGQVEYICEPLGSCSYRYLYPDP